MQLQRCDKVFSLTFAKEWLESLDVKTIQDEWGVYCEVYSQDLLILEYCNDTQPWQHHPNFDWCQEQAQKLEGYFADEAVDYICETLRELIREKLSVSLSSSTGDLRPGMNQPRDDRARYPYMPNQRVKYDFNGLKGSGVICGMASQYLAMPIIGTVWIIRLDQPIEGYPYECLAFGANTLEPLEPM